MKVVGLFAGIGGIELGLQRAGFHATTICEIDAAAKEVLKHHFPDVPLADDIRKLKKLPKGTDLLVGGFPCQDISQAGNTKGIKGKNSGLVDEVFRLLKTNDVPHVLLENVSFMLALDKGHAMRHVTSELESLGYKWAYRVIDTQAFGLPQRRQRLFIFASKILNPIDVLMHGNEDPEETKEWKGKGCGFYWTEGLRGLGWAVDAIPTLKGGSTIGIASPPAIWMPNGKIVTPSILDAERLQGFPAGWTEPALQVSKQGFRWKLVGNAVSVPAAEWIGHQIKNPQSAPLTLATNFALNKKWPVAAFGGPGMKPLALDMSMWPVKFIRKPLIEFLDSSPKPLSHKATVGFISRLRASSLKYPPEFLSALELHAKNMQTQLTMAIAA